MCRLLVIAVGFCGRDDDCFLYLGLGWPDFAGLDLPAFVMGLLVVLTLSLLLVAGSCGLVFGEQGATNAGCQWESAWSMTEFVS